MIFGIYVHTQGPSSFREVAHALSRSLRPAFDGLRLSEVDGLFLGFHSTSRIESGVSPLKRKVRRDYTLKLITGGTEHYDCLVELNSEVPDAEVIEATSESAMFEFVKSSIGKVLPVALRGFPPEDAQRVLSVVASAGLPHEPRW
jgi:hypothetical protein